MKRKLFFAAMTVAALAGCVKVEMSGSDDKSERNLITFASPVTGRSLETKVNVYGEIGSHKYDGTETVYTYPREEQFKIFAVEHVGDLTSWDDAGKPAFNENAISYNSSLDAWVPLKAGGGFYYWPDGEKLSFAAMSPAELDVTGATVAYDSKGLTINEFAIADEPEKQYDLLYSERAANQTSADMVDGADYYSGVPITFNHALSSIHFSLKTDVTETVTLTSITLKNAQNMGAFKENFNESDSSRDPEWTVSTNSQLKDYNSFTGSVNFPMNPQYVSALAAADGTSDDDKSHPLLMMPQALGDDVVVEVVYTVGGETKTRTVQLNQYPATDPITEWEVGTKYTYRLFYSKNAQIQDIIFFSPKTEGWIEGGIIEVIL